MTKVLIADDEPNILMLAGIMMEDEGYEVLRATNGVDAVSVAAAEKPDLIITDVIMPGMDGFEVCRTIRQHAELSNVPILILSALGDEFNKITGFEGGADDYITKPFNVEEFKARVRVLLNRARVQVAKHRKMEIPKQDTGIQCLDQLLQGGLPRGSNILLMGTYGTGKSTFCRQFMHQGLQNHERCLLVVLDDEPNRVRQQLAREGRRDDDPHAYEKEGLLRVIDAYSWCSGVSGSQERFAVSGALELTQLSSVIMDAGTELGQTVQDKRGGRRVIDSISSLFTHFELPVVQRFLGQIARTAVAFGDVSTLYVLEKGSVSEQVLNNVKYLMDGVIEFNEQGELRVLNMKWASFERRWVRWYQV